jgi:hypothetical protein
MCITAVTAHLCSADDVRDQDAEIVRLYTLLAPVITAVRPVLSGILYAAYRVLEFESVTTGDNVFRDLALARIIEPTSKIDAERVLTEVGVQAASYVTLKRRLPSYAHPSWRQSLARPLGHPSAFVRC